MEGAKDVQPGHPGGGGPMRDAIEKELEPLDPLTAVKADAGAEPSRPAAGGEGRRELGLEPHSQVWIKDGVAASPVRFGRHHWGTD